MGERCAERKKEERRRKGDNVREKVRKKRERVKVI
jgi:hypothetical protein